MLLFKSNFVKDIVILLVVTIILSTVLSLVIGTVSDYYFGDAVDSLIGDYKNNDLLLIIEEKQKQETITRAEKVLAAKFPGSKLETGINLAGKSNLKYKLKELGFDLDITNVNGGAIALGHPIGASGARILVTLLHEMKKRDSKYGLATLCIGGGLGAATIVSRD